MKINRMNPSNAARIAGPATSGKVGAGNAAKVNKGTTAEKEGYGDQGSYGQPYSSEYRTQP